MTQHDTEQFLRSAVDADVQLDLDEDAILARGHGLVRRRRLATAGGAAALLVATALAVPTLFPERTATPAAPPATSAPATVTPTPAAPSSVDLPFPVLDVATGEVPSLRITGVREGSAVRLTLTEVGSTRPPVEARLGSALWLEGALRDDLVLVAWDAVGTNIALEGASGPWNATDVRLPLADGTTVTVALVLATADADRGSPEKLRWIGADGTVFQYPDIALSQAHVLTREGLPVSVVVEGDSLHLYQGGLQAAVDRSGDRYGTFLIQHQPTDGGWQHLRAGELPRDATDIDVTWSDAATATAFQTTFLNDPSVGMVWFAEGTLPESNDGRLVTIEWTDGAGIRHTIEA